jgi:gas vesicle protein
MTDQHICEFCSVVYKNEVNLKLHLIRSKKCLKKRGLSLESKNNCKECGKTFVALANLTVHHKISLVRKEYEKEIDQRKKEYEKEIDHYKKEYEKEIDQRKKENDKLNETIFDLKRHHSNFTNELHEKYKKEISDINQNHNKDFKNLKERFDSEKQLLEKHIERLQTSFENMTKEAINRPSTTTNTNTNSTTINNIRNVLSTKHTIDDLEYDDLVNVFKKTLTEDILLGGQIAIAKICNDNIIKSDDEKMMLCCTDASRDKFKYMDKSGNLKEDIRVRNFTSKIIKPLETVGEEVYNNSCAMIKEEISNLDQLDYGKKASLNSKEDRLHLSMYELRGIDRPDYNSKFVNEMAILTKQIL